MVTPTPNSSKSTAGMRRAGTLIRSPLDGRKDKDKSDDGNMRASDVSSNIYNVHAHTFIQVFGLILEQIATLVYHEEDFVTKFLQFKDSALTYADYMGLDSYFRRQARRGAGMSQSTLKLVRGAMDLIFGFLPLEIKSWVDSALAKDNMYGLPLTAHLFVYSLAGKFLGCSFAWSDSKLRRTRKGTNSSSAH